MLSRWTSARVALGRAGASMPTDAVLEFAMDHARARDSVHTPLDTEALEEELRAEGFSTLRARSRARNRSEYLRRPDLGRTLDPACEAALLETGPPHAQGEGAGRLTVVVADGLSSAAPAMHAVPLLREIRLGLDGWTLDAVVIATQSRVALADGIGALRCAEAVLILIGERPGLKSADSLGAYLTYLPRLGRTDAERNCVSNIRPAGLSYAAAAHKLLYLLREARVLGQSGVALKDNSDLALLPVAQAGQTTSANALTSTQLQPNGEEIQ